MQQAILTGKLQDVSFFIGIDVSKATLDFALIQDDGLIHHKVIENNSRAVRLYIKELKDVPGYQQALALFCLENTGIYGNILVRTLHKLGAAIVVEHPLRIKRSSGIIRGKSDKMDAIRIARYAATHWKQLTLWAPRRDIINELASLASIRYRLVGLSTTLKTPLTQQRLFEDNKRITQNKRLCRASLSAVEKDIEKIESLIKLRISQYAELERFVLIITSVPGVGMVTALQIIISTNEFKTITDPRKFASYAGVAPFPTQSGKVNRVAKVSNLANKRMKYLLHVCAVSAVRNDAELRSYYERKVNEGKAKMLVINAVRFKIILRIFACIRQGRRYVKYSANSV